MTMRTHRSGMTLIETSLAIAIAMVILVPVSTLIWRGTAQRAEDEAQLLQQQTLAQIQRALSTDARASSGLTIAAEDHFTLRRVRPDDTVEYISYRLTGGRLQRGTSSNPALAPSAWRDLLDPGFATVRQGRFAYYGWNNTPPSAPSAIKRVALEQLELESRKASFRLAQPIVSAAGRPRLHLQSLVMVSAVSRANEMVEIEVKNQSTEPVDLAAFRMFWSSSDPDTYLQSIKAPFLSGNQFVWKAKYEEGAGAAPLTQTLTVPPGQSIVMELHLVHQKTLDDLSILFYDPDDLGRLEPYLIEKSGRSP